MESPPRKLPPKKDVVLAFLERGSARLFVDPRREGVAVPKWFLKQPELVLRLGHDLNPPIPDLEISDEAVSCTLSFNRSPFWCRLPYAAIYAVVSDADGRGVVWPDDVPIESQILKAQEPAPPPARGPKRKLSAVPPAPSSSTQAAPPPAASEVDEAERAPAQAHDGGGAPEAPTVEALVAAAAPERAHDVAGADEAEAAPKKPKRQLPPYLRVVK